MRYWFAILAAMFLTVLALSGCSSAGGAKLDYAPAELLLTPNPEIAPSRTPFQPGLLLQTPSGSNKSATSLPGDSSQITLNPAYSHRTNILVLGSDWRPNSGYRTDVILLVSLDKIHGDVSIVSFPRDLWVRLPGMGEERINTAMEFGGFPLAQGMFFDNFGIKIDHYIITNFQGFVNLVDSLGGINVLAGIELYDTCSLPQASGGYCYIAPGLNPMDGATALWYVRSRGTTSDFDRTRRAQEVLKALFEKLISLDAVNKTSQLFSSLSGTVETDMTPAQILPFLPLAAQTAADPARIRQFFIGPAEAFGYIIPSTGANVLLPNMEAIQSLLDQAGGK
jgi:LCP family protein required for cell wall assembly